MFTNSTAEKWNGFQMSILAVDYVTTEAVCTERYLKCLGPLTVQIVTVNCLLRSTEVPALHEWHVST